MSVGDRDQHTGHMTTGHNWNGITELNSPVPKLVWLFLSLAILYSVVHWVLMPAWPSLTSFTRGVLQTDQHREVAQALAAGKAQRAPWQDKISTLPVSTIAQDPQLSSIGVLAGARLFGDNCAVCHGMQGGGGPGYPALNDGYWLWGNDPTEILKTLQVGINSTHPQTRVGQMPAFTTLNATQLNSLIDYIKQLSVPGGEPDAELAKQVNEGKQTFGMMCAACHGANATGNSALGAPNLTDNAWIYGADDKTLRQTIRGGRAGVMPAWDSRLSLAEQKMLVLYLIQLSTNTTPHEPVGSGQ